MRSSHRSTGTLGRLAAVIVATSLIGPPLTAGQEIVSTSPDTGEAHLSLAAHDGRIELSLEDAILVALRNNIGLQVQRYRRSQAFEGIRQNLGIYDLNLGVTATTDSETSPAATALAGALINKSQSQNLNLSLDQLFDFGGTLSLDWANRRSESNSFFVGVNPSFNINWDVLFSQPLLAGRGRTTTERNLRVARTNSQISLEQLSLQVINSIEQVEDAYWALVESQQQLEVSRQSLELAKELHQMNQVQVEVGTMAPLELTESEVGVAVREEEVLRAEATADDTADRLRQLLNVESGPLWDAAIDPATDPRIDRLEIDVDESLETALEDRSEITQQQLAVKNLELDAKVQHQLLLPRLDLQLRYGYNGLGGDVIQRENIFDPNSPVVVTPGGYTDALKQIYQAKYDGWQAAVSFGLPLQNRQAKARATIADLALAEGIAQLHDIELGVSTEVRQAVRGVQTAAKAIDLATVSRELAEKNLDAEQKRYENGLSTTFDVLRIQDDLSGARSREVSAITSYRRALVVYYMAIGRLLENKGIVLEDDLAQQ